MSPRSAKNTLCRARVPFNMRSRVFSSRKPHSAMRVRIVEDPTLISDNQVFLNLLSIRAEKERPRDTRVSRMLSVKGSIESALFSSRGTGGD